MGTRFAIVQATFVFVTQVVACSSPPAEQRDTPLGGSAEPLVTVPSRASEPVVVRSRSGVRVAFTARGATDVPAEQQEDGWVFRGGINQSTDAYDLSYRLIEGGVEDLVTFHSEPEHEHLVYDLDVRAVAGLRLVANVLELLDAGGAPRLRIRSPFLVDAAGDRHQPSWRSAGALTTRARSLPGHDRLPRPALRRAS